MRARVTEIVTELIACLMCDTPWAPTAPERLRKEAAAGKPVPWWWREGHAARGTRDP